VRKRRLSRTRWKVYNEFKAAGPDLSNEERKAADLIKHHKNT
jgi:hypothetical protein